MKYIETLKPGQVQNMNLIITSLHKSRITNLFAQGATLGVCSKECEFNMAEEISYKNTPNERIRAVFGTHFTGISDAAINALKSDDRAFFDHVYGGMYGNKPNQGFLYRGRGFNDVTFEGNYAMLTRESGWTPADPSKGHNLVDHPELLDNPEIAAECVPYYFWNKFYSMPNEVAADIHAKGINDFTNLEDAITGLYRANAGWGNKIFPDVTGGFYKAHSRAQEFYDLLTSNK